MLYKFISVSETRFQKTKTALKNQQASIQGLETQIGQLSKLISERQQGSFPLELQQDNAMNKGREEVNDDDPKQEPPRTKTTETEHYYQVANKDTHEERRFQIEELDEWRATIAHERGRSEQSEARPCNMAVFNTRPRHTGKKAAVPSSKRRRGSGSSSVYATAEVRHPFLEFPKLRKRSYFRYYTHDHSLQVLMMNNDDPGTIHFRLGALAPISFTYDPSHSKASALPPSLRYLHAILVHTLTRRRESTGVVNTHDAYYLWCMGNAHVTDLAYFIAFAIRHSPSDRAAQEGSDLHWPLRDAPCLTFRPPQHRGPVISVYTDRSNVPTGHHDYVTHEDDRVPTWD
ncbi:hypothetical protein GOBAR_AA23936 [Gossypium barbadense]|uniref:Uncharacterized protein n=1 Tax=Gossypium barbadense TaxID=3634 RepID=A0A2P5X072_GOSBA|nr:hypothetical protein GOBAR_AA23936 [Gossypium barbadense]